MEQPKSPDTKNQANEKLYNRRNKGQLTHLIADKYLLPRPEASSPMSDSPSSGSPGNVTLTEPESLKLTQKTKSISKQLISLKSQIVSTSKTLIEFIQGLEKKALNEVLEAEFELNSFTLKVEKKKPIDLELFKRIKEIKLEIIKESPNLDEAMETLQKAFKVSEELKMIAESRKKSVRSRKSIDSSPFVEKVDESLNDDEFLVFAKDYESGLVAVDFNTLKERKVAFGPKILPYHILCRISRSRYFISGGYDGEKSTDDSYIFDLGSKTCRKLRSSIERDGAGSVYKDNKVFIFGGIHTNVEDLQLCQYYNISLQTWHELSPLPMKSHANTASLIDDLVILTGFHLNGIYLFDGSCYSNLVSLQENSFKHLFGRWAIDGKAIYKSEDISNNLWVSFNCEVQFKLGWLCCFSGFRNKKFIYFVEESNGILRLDTEQNKIEVIGTCIS